MKVQLPLNLNRANFRSVKNYLKLQVSPEVWQKKSQLLRDLRSDAVGLNDIKSVFYLAVSKPWLTNRSVRLQKFSTMVQTR